jgi:hypothetical protein
MDDAAAARRMWTLFEPVHAIVYFSAEARSELEQAGLRGFWRGYFAGRAAPLGEIGPAPVTAAFFTFAPSMVARALPGVWQLISPASALAVRSAAAVSALRRLLGASAANDSASGASASGASASGASASGVAAPSVAEAADLLLRVADSLDCSGRVLAAANAALPSPGEPLARLWHAATLLREHRGDGHFAALVAAGVDGCEALVLRAGHDENFRAQLQPLRGWTDEDWEQAAARLTERGWLDPAGRVTPEGASAHRAVEAATDLAAARPWALLGADGTEELEALLAPIARACAAELPFPNPVGVPEPAGGVTQG